MMGEENQKEQFLPIKRRRRCDDKETERQFKVSIITNKLNLQNKLICYTGNEKLGETPSRKKNILSKSEREVDAQAVILKKLDMEK